MKKFLNSVWYELRPIATFLLASVLYALIIAFGILYELFVSIKLSFQWKFWKGLQHFVTYWLRILYQFWNVIKFLLDKLSLVVDLLGNVGSGELIEKLTTTRKDTWFGKGKIYISAALGQEEHFNNADSHGDIMKPFGQKLTKLLSKVFEKNHSINAYDLKVMTDKFKKERNIKFDA